MKEFLGLGYYTSELDSFIAEFDKKNQKLSESQQKEKMIYARVFALRDGAILPEVKAPLWEDFKE